MIFGFYFDTTKGDKYKIKEILKNPSELDNKLAKYKKTLKKLGWTLSEYINATFPSIYSHVIKKNKEPTKIINILKKYKITSPRKIKKYNIPKTPKTIKLNASQYGVRKATVGDKVLIYLRDLNGIVYITNNGSFILTLGLLAGIYSKKKIKVQDSFNNYYYVDTKEVAPVLIDVYGYQYYEDLERKATAYITGNTTYNTSYTSNTSNIGNIGNIGNTSVYSPISIDLHTSYGIYYVVEGDYVVMRLRTRDGRVILENDSYVPVVAYIKEIITKHNITLVDTIGNTHGGVSYTELEPVLLDINGQAVYDNMTTNALDVYLRTP